MTYYLLVIVKFIIGFVIVLTHMNISGKTQLSQMTPVDFIGNFVLGGIIGGVIYSDTIPLTQYIIILLMGVSFISIINWVSKHISVLRAVTIGNPIPIIKNGVFIMDSIHEKRNKIDILNITSRMHAQGIYSYRDVYYAQIEPDGQLTVICDQSQMPSVIVMKDGVPRKYELEQIGHDEAWLAERLKQQGIDDPESVFLAEFYNGSLNVVMKDGRMTGHHSEPSQL